MVIPTEGLIYFVMSDIARKGCGTSDTRVGAVPYGGIDMLRMTKGYDRNISGGSRPSPTI